MTQMYAAFLPCHCTEDCIHQFACHAKRPGYNTMVCIRSIPSPPVWFPPGVVTGTCCFRVLCMQCDEIKPALKKPKRSAIAVQELLQCLKELLRLDKAWLPHQEGYSMYIRPFAFSSAHTLGISKPGRYSSQHMQLYVLGS